MISRHSARTLRGLGVAAASVVVLAGCGNPFDASDQHPAAEPEPNPTYAEIQEELFATMLAADSVSVTAEVAAGEAGLDQIFDEIDEDDIGQLEISGALDGMSSQMSFSAGDGSFTQITVDGSDYFSGPDFASLLVSELDEDVADAVDEELITEIIGDQWVEFPGEATGIYSAEELFETWQQQYTSESLGEMTGELQQRDGEQVWVFEADGGETEFVLAVDDEPYLLRLAEAGAEYELSEWGSSDAPDEPAESITLDEIYEAIAEDQGWDPQDLEDSDDDDQATAMENA